MAADVREMIRKSMDAFLAEDVEKAQATAQMDDRIDSVYQSLFSWVVEQMGSGALSVPHGTFLLWTGHNLERIGDRATNICERVIFTKTGETGRGMNPKQGEN
jgi:phosphate transport system protein